MNIAEQDIAAICAFGYTEDEARFLYLVATHSGYFVPRQFLALSGAKWGYRTDQLTKKLESRGHASWREYPGTGGVYHLFAKRIYAGIGKENLRNRRRHAAEFIQTRLVLLDFVIANPQYDYLETEQKKVGYFCETLCLPKTCLPVKTYEGNSGGMPTLRYFVDKYPLFFASLSSGLPPVVTLSYVDPGYASVAGFAHHLNAYMPLLRELTEFRFLFISNSTANFQDAEKCFSSVFAAPNSRDIAADILRYFRFRKAWEEKKYGLFSNPEIEWLNAATRRFSGPRVDSLYPLWCAGRTTDEDLRREFPPPDSRKMARFGSYLVCRSHRETGKAGTRQKRSSVPDFRRRTFSLQPSAEVNCTERKQIGHKDRTEEDAAKFDRGGCDPAL